MATHVISNRASIDVQVATPAFFDMSPTIDTSTKTRRVKFLSPRGQTHTVKIAFKFRPRGFTSTMAIGIKQFIEVDPGFGTG